jgi:hypothetical protein
MFASRFNAPKCLAAVSFQILNFIKIQSLSSGWCRTQSVFITPSVPTHGFPVHIAATGDRAECELKAELTLNQTSPATGPNLLRLVSGVRPLKACYL